MKIKVPEGMLKAAITRFKFLAPEGKHQWRKNEFDQQCKLCGAIDCSSAGDFPCLGVSFSTVGLAVEAALRWLLPELQKQLEMVIYDCCHSLSQPSMRNLNWGGYKDYLQKHVHVEVDRMFLVPEEIKDLLWNNPPANDGRRGSTLVEEAERRILEAYRRGQRSKS